MSNSTWKYGNPSGTVCRSPLGGAVLRHFFESCVLHSLSASSMAFLKYIGADSATESGMGTHSTVACRPPAAANAPMDPVVRLEHVSRNTHVFPLDANIRTRHFLKFRISSHASSSAALELGPWAMGAMTQCPGTSRPACGRARYARFPYATWRCLNGFSGLSRKCGHRL
jgi:hypothetical protein